MLARTHVPGNADKPLVVRRAAGRVYKIGYDPERHVEDGKGIDWWVRLYFDYTSFLMGAPIRFTWPMGLPPDVQPALLVSMFDEIEAGILQEMKLDAK